MKEFEPIYSSGFNCFDAYTCEYEVRKGWILPILFDANENGKAFQNFINRDGWKVQDLDSYLDLCLWDEAKVPMIVILTEHGYKLASGQKTSCWTKI